MKFLNVSTTVMVSALFAVGSHAAEQLPLTGEGVDDTTITFGMPAWTSTEAPTAIAEQILEEAGYTVEKKLLAQPAIFQGMQVEQIDFFMDAWLPYTEQALWQEYKSDLQKVATSYYYWLAATLHVLSVRPEVSGRHARALQLRQCLRAFLSRH